MRKSIEQESEPPFREAERLKVRLEQHALYGVLDTPDRVRAFMERHVFAVWDFMLLIKSLQASLTSVEGPWVPPADAAAARFVNEIVLGEESDEVSPGRILSHLELYIEAMEEIEADVTPIRSLIDALRRGASAREALLASRAPDAARRFVEAGLGATIDPLHMTAAAFCHGREDAIPRMFRSIIATLDRHAIACPTMRLYLERHIEVDGEQHGPMAEALLDRLCGGEPGRIRDAEGAAERALASRDRFWTEIHADLLALDSPAMEGEALA